MLTLNLTKDQLGDLIVLLDHYIKTFGVQGLQKSVDLFNLLNSAKVIEEKVDSLV